MKLIVSWTTRFGIAFSDAAPEVTKASVRISELCDHMLGSATRDCCWSKLACLKKQKITFAGYILVRSVI